MSDNLLDVVHLTILHSRYDTRIYLKQCRTLCDYGHRVILLVGDGKGDEIRDGIRILDVGSPPKGRLARFVRQSYRMHKIVRSLKPDIVHFHDPELMIVAKVFQFSGTNIIFDVHENVSKDILTKPWIHKSLRLGLAYLYKVIEWIFSVGMNLILAEKSYLLSYGSYPCKKKLVLENLPLLNTTELMVSSEDKYKLPTVVYFGSVTVGRGALRLVRVVNQVRLAGLQANLIIIGPVSEEVSNSKEYQQAIDDSWLFSHGYIPAEQALNTVACCHVGVAVLDPEPNFVESYPTKMFEYMALALPVIVSNFKLYQDVVDDANCGFTVDPSDESRFQLLLKDILSDPKGAVKIGLKGSKAIFSKYNWSTQSDGLLKLYQEIGRR